MKLPEEITQEAIKEWKQKYGHVGVLQLPNDKVAVVRRPSRNTVGEFEKHQDASPNDARKVLIENCVLWGKEDVLVDDALFFSCARGLIDLIPVSKPEFVTIDGQELPHTISEETKRGWLQDNEHVGVLLLPNGKVAVVRRPSRNTVGEFEKKQDSSPNGARNVLIENCVLWGKEDVLADDELFFSCARGLIDLIPISKAEFVAF